MKFLLFAAASVLAFGAGGCTAQKPATRAALDCPATEGDLTRTGVAPDRRTCTYRTRDGADVSLRLVNTNGDARGALKAIEASLVGTPAAAGAPPSAAQAGTAEEAARTAEQARQDAGVTVDIDVDGKKVATTPADGEETTRVDLPGVHIVAGENDAAVRVGGLTVIADDGKATVRVMSDQRVKGEAFSRKKRGLHATFIYTGENLPNGYRFVGYEAAGPKAGPLAVAVVRAKTVEEDEHGIHRDVKRLVRRNSGV